MDQKPNILSSTWRAVQVLIGQCRGENPAHNCAVSGSADCSWRRADLVELAELFEREMGLRSVNSLLLKLEAFRQQIYAERKTNGTLEGADGTVESVPIPMGILNEVGAVLAQVSNPRLAIVANLKPEKFFTLRPVEPPTECEIKCKKCSNEADMVKEDAWGNSYLCYLHTVAWIVELEVRSR